MRRSTLTLALVGGAAVLGIALWTLFNNGVLQINANAFQFRGEPAARPPDLLPTPAPEPLSSGPQPTSSPVLEQITAKGETPAQRPAPGVEVMPTPTPNLTSSQIFSLLDAGKISHIEALQMLGSRTPVNDQWLDQLGGLIHDMVNQERQKANINVLEFDSALSATAASDSRYLAELLDGAGQTDSIRVEEPARECFTRYGVAYIESNVNSTLSTPVYSHEIYYDGVPVRKAYLSTEQLAEQIVDTWMQRPVQRQEIRNSVYRKHAVGLAVSKDEEVFVTQYFC